MCRAVQLAAESRVPLTILHVWQFPVYGFAGEAPIPEDFIQSSRMEAEKRLVGWSEEARKLGAGRVSTMLVEGVPWDRIVEVLRNDPSYDLAVLGTHGRTGLKHVLVGSVAEKVVRHAPCPVLVVRPRE
jgi:nucleotide-binding universal stress UspA family protein